MPVPRVTQEALEAIANPTNVIMAFDDQARRRCGGEDVADEKNSLQAVLLLDRVMEFETILVGRGQP